MSPALSAMPRRSTLITGAVLLLLALLAALDFATRPPPLPDFAQARAAWRPSEAWLYDRHGVLIDSQRVNFAARRLAWTPLGKIAPVVPETIIAAEDKRFRAHGGVDLLGLAGALRDRFGGGRARGASTITMQLAAFLAPDLAAPGARGWRDKLRQMRAAWAIERGWRKEQILEAYLNLAGFRGEAQGIGAAALGLFGKTPETLGREEALLLAALLPDPRAGPARVAARACRLNRGRDCAALVSGAWAMLGPARSLALDPGLAPHLAQHLLNRPGLRVRTTLDARVQRLAAQALRHQLAVLGSRARDGTVIVADVASGEVLAYVGGIAGGGSTAPAVDNAAAYRQAGSTLKPFLYAQAIEHGYLTPASILDDSPVQLDTASGLYVPQNYDRAFKGPVSARTALAGSLNVPAVRTLLLVGVEAFRDRLWDTGYRGLVEDGDYYGFSLALGSAEVTLAEQVAAYRALASGGLWAPLRFTPGAAPAPRRVTSPQAAWLVSDMLADANARAVTFGLDSALRLPFWAAVKTGTSKAMRDNWCVGFSSRYVVGVWIGNAEGDSMHAVSGTSGAAPVWRDVMRALHADAPGRAPAPPSGIEARRVAFAGTSEPARRDYFLAGTGQTLVSAAPAAARRPRIVSPVSGSVYALDADIPPANQRLAVSLSGAAEGHRLWLDGQALASSLLFPTPGRHLLRLVEPGGRVVDQVVFTVR